jgi:hypothetical protein
LFAGVAMVLLQYMVVHAVLSGNSPACGSSDQCTEAGTFCMIGAPKGGDRCWFCGDEPPLPQQTDPATGGAWNKPDVPDFVGFNLTAVAELCADPSVVQYTGGWHVPSSIVSWCKSTTLLSVV